MLISNFNLCKTEWLDLVFAKRNKEYGAYYLRQHYAENVVKAMGITFFSIISLSVIAGITMRVKPVTEIMIPVDMKPYEIPPTPPKQEPKKEQAPAPKPQPPVNTVKYVEMVTTPDPVTIDPPKISLLAKSVVGPIDISGRGNGDNLNIPDEAGAGGSGTSVGPDKSNEVHIYADVMPEPYGGAAGWAKFLQKTMKYPPQALDGNISGRVLVSFVIEKDGSLSSVKVDRGAGFGMDEEALRVLKLSKAWKPGLQNGQPVRVKFSIPISFSLSQ